MSSKDNEYEVGYGKPPEHTRFKPGHSGNPKGRPRGSRNFASDLDDVLDEQMTVSEQGRSRKVSAQLAALMRLREKALNGDARALDRLLALAGERWAEREADNRERSISADQEEILARFIERSQGQPDGEDDHDDE